MMVKKQTGLSRFIKSIDFWDIALITLFVVGVFVIIYISSTQEAVLQISLAVVEAIIIGVVVNRLTKKALKS